VDARWEDLDLDAAEWRLVGKNDKVDAFELNPKLVRELRIYRAWIKRQAEVNDQIKDALDFNEAAFVLLTANGRPPESLKPHQDCQEPWTQGWHRNQKDPRKSGVSHGANVTPDSSRDAPSLGEDRSQ